MTSGSRLIPKDGPMWCPARTSSAVSSRTGTRATAVSYTHLRAVLEKERNQVLRLSDQEAERLGKGEVIQKAVEVNGEKTQQYLQLDPETKDVYKRQGLN